MSEREAYERKMDAMLGEWPERISLMEERVPAIAELKRPVYADLMKQLHACHQAALRALADYRAAAESTWPDARKKLERAWSDLANTYEKALCQFEGVKN